MTNEEPIDAASANAAAASPLPPPLGRRSTLLALAALASSLLPGAAAAAADASFTFTSTSAAAAIEALDGTLVVKSLRSRLASGVGSFMRSRQRADGGARLLAPVKTVRRRLRDAAGMLLAALDGAEPAAVAAVPERSGSGSEVDPEAVLSGRLFGGDGRRRRQAAPATASGRGGEKPPPTGGLFGKINRATKKSSSSSTFRDDGLPRPAAFRPILEAVRAGSGECYTFDALDGALPLPQSLVGGGGAANCTLSLVARNAASSLPTREVRGEALRRATLDEADAAIRAVRLLDDLLERAAEGDRAAAGGVAAALEGALRSVAALEGLVAACLNFDGEQPTSDYDE